MVVKDVFPVDVNLHDGWWSQKVTTACSLEVIAQHYFFQQLTCVRLCNNLFLCLNSRFQSPLEGTPWMTSSKSQEHSEVLWFPPKNITVTARKWWAVTGLSASFPSFWPSYPKLKSSRWATTYLVPTVISWYCLGQRIAKYRVDTWRWLVFCRTFWVLLLFLFFGWVNHAFHTKMGC